MKHREKRCQLFRRRKSGAADDDHWRTNTAQSSCRAVHRVRLRASISRSANLRRSSASGGPVEKPTLATIDTTSSDTAIGAATSRESRPRNTSCVRCRRQQPASAAVSLAENRPDDLGEVGPDASEFDRPIDQVHLGDGLQIDQQHAQCRGRRRSSTMTPRTSATRRRRAGHAPYARHAPRRPIEPRRQFPARRPGSTQRALRRHRGRYVSADLPTIASGASIDRPTGDILVGAVLLRRSGHAVRIGLGTISLSSNGAKRQEDSSTTCSSMGTTSPASIPSARRTGFFRGRTNDPRSGSGKIEVRQDDDPILTSTRMAPKPRRGPSVSARISAATSAGRVMKHQPPSPSWRQISASNANERRVSDPLTRATIVRRRGLRPRESSR